MTNIISISMNFKSAVAIIFDDQMRILWGKSVSDDDRNGCWCFPGGGVDKNESPLMAAIREAYEETGLIVEPISQIGITHPTKPKVAFFLMRLKAGEQKIKPNEEFEELAFFSSPPEGCFALNLDLLRSISLMGQTMKNFNIRDVVTQNVFKSFQC